MSTRRNVATALLLGAPVLSKGVSTNDTDAAKTITARKVAPKERLSEETARILSYTIYAEARGEPYEGKRAVASVIATRALMLRRTMAEICLHEKQFSSWNTINAVPQDYVLGTDMNLTDHVARVECYGLAWELISYRKRWDRFTHFYNPSKANPSWANELQNVKMIGNHVFGFMDPRHLPRI